GRPNLFFILVPAVALWLFFRHSRRAGGVRLAAACLIGTFILLVPPILYNVSQTGRFVPVTAHGGINFYIGNGPKARSIYRPPEGMRRDMRGLIEDTKLGAEREVGRSLTNAEASDYWFGAALDRIFTDPAGWLRLVGMKLLVFWNGIEVPDIIDLSFYRDSCPVLKLLFIPFAVISPLSLLGLIILLKGRRNRGIVLLFVLAALVSVLLFYVNSRYRMPSIPILVLASAVSVSWVIEAIAGRRWTQVIAVASLFTALLLLVSTREIIVINRSAMYNFLGNHYMEITEEVKAEAAFAEAYRLDPESIEAQINYGRVLRKRGREEKAERFYAEAYGSRPDFPRLAIEYGSLLERMGRRKEAKKLYLYALSLERAHDRVLACKLLSRAA
ncbi:MAG: hypothetical protein KAX38_07085, partial [Candidatus Krumholzibacteria bacterium]|nr:hypothetical protein [Candidatus Krumholzibacteria bacterium]